MQSLEPRVALDAAAAGCGCQAGLALADTVAPEVRWVAPAAGPAPAATRALSFRLNVADRVAVADRPAVSSTPAIPTEDIVVQADVARNATALEQTSPTVGATADEAVPSAEARSIGEILAEFGEAQNGLLEGYRLFQSGDPAAASLALQEAQAVLDGVKDDLVHPSVAEALGRKLQTALRKTGLFQERIRLAQEYVERGSAKAVVFLNKVTSTWKFGQKAANLLGKPMLALREPSAGFYAAGKTATLRFATPAGCTSPPVVTVENVFGRRALDTANVVVDEARSLIRVPIGWETGAGRVTVTNCNCGTSNKCVSQRILLYNKGPSLPENFPINLQKGNYRLSVSVDGGPSVVTGTTRLTNLRDFANQVQRIINRAVSTIQLPGACTKSLTWLPDSDTRFGYTYTIRCTVEGQTVSSTVSFLIERI